MVEKVESLIERVQAIIQYLKRGRREQVLAFVVIACLFVATTLNAPESWLPFLLPLKSLLGSYLRVVTYVVAGAGAVAFVLLAWFIYRRVQLPAPLPEKITPSVIKGPLSFGPQDGEFFQKLGRDKELQKILDYVKDPQVPLVVVMGESGAGKTSLLRAGLDCCCKRENIPAVYWEAVPSEPVTGLIDTVNRCWAQSLNR